MLWGGRFTESLKDSAMRFSSSLDIDIQLYEEDILCSTAHAKMLNQIGILNDSELELIVSGLAKIKNELAGNTWIPSKDEFEDIHSAIESRLFSIIGDAAGKLHTGRSRNDQVITDVRLWTKKSLKNILNTITLTQKAFLKIAEGNEETIIPGYTHLQRAQPISLAFHMLAYVEMLERDYKRINFVLSESDVSPLGSGALAGSTLPLNREYTAEQLGFSTVSGNALDSVSDRDFILDSLNACSVGMIHLSRFAEEIIIWTSAEWNMATLSDSVSTGSSLMPQKKNPDLAELLRGKTSSVIGNDMSMKSLMKGLPLSYNRDLQEDKVLLFNSCATYFDALSITSLILENIKFNTSKFAEQMNGDFILATDIADWLVLEGVPFRSAHHAAGEVVKYCESISKKLNQLSVEELKNINPAFDEKVLEVFDITKSLHRKKTIGSPNPEMVKGEIVNWFSVLKARGL